MAGNLYADIPAALAREETIDLLGAQNLRIERIVSRGQATPPGEWLDQDWDEWVVLLEGAAGLRLAGEEPRVLGRGDWLHIAAHTRHRVEWTGPGATLWLAVHWR